MSFLEVAERAADSDEAGLSKVFLADPQYDHGQVLLDSQIELPPVLVIPAEGLHAEVPELREELLCCGIEGGVFFFEEDISPHPSHGGAIRWVVAAITVESARDDVFEDPFLHVQVGEVPK